MSNYMMLKL